MLLAGYPQITVLQDASVEVGGLWFYGSPWQPWFGGWAFNFPRGDRGTAREVWSRIPAATQVLVTHGPPHDILDRCYPSGKLAGDKDLRRRTQTLERLRLHVFGHIHEAYGTVASEGVTYVNASICTLQYRPANAPVVVEVDATGAAHVLKL